MAWTNYHCHSDFCDGTESPTAMVEAAIGRGLLALGLSSHAPLPFARPWCLGRGRDPSALERYKAEIEGLRGRFGGLIDVHAGLEVDYIPGLMGPADEAFAGFDYRIGAVHFVGLTREGLPWQMDDSPDSFKIGLDELYGGDIRALVEAYFAALREMVVLERPDLVAHIDLVKKFNRGSRFFHEGAAWYRELVDGALMAVADSGLILELNTGGISRGWTEEGYPGPWALRRCRELGIPLTLSSDCHRAADLDFGFAQAAGALAAAGYEELMVLEAGLWRPAGFDCRGLARRPRALAA